jgi:hypothetical protein
MAESGNREALFNLRWRPKVRLATLATGPMVIELGELSVTMADTSKMVLDQPPN